MEEPIKKLNVDLYNELVGLEKKTFTDWHSKNTIIFGSLIEDGFDWGKDKWQWSSYVIETDSPAYNMIRERINRKIEERYFFDEIGVTVPAQFRMYLKSRIEQSMAKNAGTYDELLKGLDLREAGSAKTVSRVVNSDYPQAQLDSSNNDYAKDATESSTETINKGGQLNSILQYSSLFNEPDEDLLRNIRVCFSNILGFNF